MLDLSTSLDFLSGPDSDFSREKSDLYMVSSLKFISGHGA